MPLLIIFIIIPLIEISLFLSIGAEIGMISTLLLCVLTAAIGAVLVKAEGLRTMATARQTLERHEMPVQEIFDGLCLVVAGLCLLTPGFFTDTLGFSLLLPAARRRLRHYLTDYWTRHSGGGKPDFRAGPTAPPGENGVIEGDYERIDNDKP